MRAQASTSQPECFCHRHETHLIEQASQDFAAQTPRPIADGCEYSTGTTTNSESFRAAFPSLEARMSLIFSWPVKAAAGMIARDRAVAEGGSQERRSRRRGLR